jgi:hypothetical protein
VRGPADRTTLRQTVLIGTPDPTGYALLTAGGPELHTVRSELGGAAYYPTYYVTAFVQMTDLHIVDDQAPQRVEFLDQYANPVRRTSRCMRLPRHTGPVRRVGRFGPGIREDPRGSAGERDGTASQ